MNVIYVDDEYLAVERFKKIAEELTGIKSLRCFTSASAAEEHTARHKVDLAFLDIEMPGKGGMGLAKSLWALDENTRIIFITAHDNYALPAFQIGIIGYVLKPYSAKEIEAELKKAARFKDVLKKQVHIRTMPNFDILVDGEVFGELKGKPKELLALLVDRRGRIVPPGEAISCLWENRPNDNNTSTLLRMTMKRLRDILKARNLLFLLDKNEQRAVNTSAFTCDYYDILSGKSDIFGGRYMTEYSWAEETTARLERICNPPV